MDQARLIRAIDDEQAALDELLAKLDEQQMTQPGVYGELSIKDVLAHIVAWERMEHEWLQASLRGETVIRFAPGYELGTDDAERQVDRLNERIYQENKDKTVQAVLGELGAAQQQIVQTVQALSDDDLNDPQRFDWWEGEPIWTSIAGNTYEHVREHRELIEAWLREDEQPGRSQ